MKETKNSKEIKGTKGQETKAIKSAEEKQEKKMGNEEKKNGKKETAKTGHGEQMAIKKLMEDTMKKIANLAGDIETVPRAKYTGYKLNGRLLSSIYGRKLSFDMSIHEYGEKGTHTGTEHFEIKSTSKDVGVVITGLLKQVEKNYGFLKEAAKPKKKVAKTEPKKETKKADELFKRIVAKDVESAPRLPEEEVAVSA